MIGAFVDKLRVCKPCSSNAAILMSAISGFAAESDPQFKRDRFVAGEAPCIEQSFGV
jgi:hypothetical protein